MARQTTKKVSDPELAFAEAQQRLRDLNERLDAGGADVSPAELVEAEASLRVAEAQLQAAGRIRGAQDERSRKAALAALARRAAEIETSELEQRRREAFAATRRYVEAALAHNERIEDLRSELGQIRHSQDEGSDAYTDSMPDGRVGHGVRIGDVSAFAEPLGQALRDLSFWASYWNDRRGRPFAVEIADNPSHPQPEWTQLEEPASADAR